MISNHLLYFLTHVLNAISSKKIKFVDDVKSVSLNDGANGRYHRCLIQRLILAGRRGNLAAIDLFVARLRGNSFDVLALIDFDRSSDDQGQRWSKIGSATRLDDGSLALALTCLATNCRRRLIKAKADEPRRTTRDCSDFCWSWSVCATGGARPRWSSWRR